MSALTILCKGTVICLITSRRSPLLLQQDYPMMEIIIVEDRSNDGTYDYLLEATKIDERLKMVRVQHLPRRLQFGNVPPI